MSFSTVVFSKRDTARIPAGYHKKGYPQIRISINRASTLSSLGYHGQAIRHRQCTVHKRRTALRTTCQNRPMLACAWGEARSTGKAYRGGLDTGVRGLDLEKQSMTHLGTHGDSNRWSGRKGCVFSIVLPCSCSRLRDPFLLI
ncbi:hypothetical protein CC2G_014321 [Coprinopsis cinerea AmutBmut pab1-1]|nr:hypothetical protein CC2G_014321 [Coprinopsis cinerea AmutBmut pab1-1]